MFEQNWSDFKMQMEGLDPNAVTVDAFARGSQYTVGRPLGMIRRWPAIARADPRSERNSRGVFADKQPSNG